MENQRLNRRRRRRNLPAELKVEIVDCFPVENAVHFLANVPNRLIIHHCAPRVRRILKMIHQIAIGYGRTLPAANSNSDIILKNGLQYTPEMDIFLRYGAAHCRDVEIWPGTSGNGFVGYPVDFFDDLIKHYYQTKVPEKGVRRLDIELSLTKPAPWPTALVQPQAGEMNVKVLAVYNNLKWVKYILRNKHNSGIAFKLHIFFKGDAKCYQQMTCFNIGSSSSRSSSSSSSSSSGRSTSGSSNFYFFSSAGGGGHGDGSIADRFFYLIVVIFWTLVLMAVSYLLLYCFWWLCCQDAMDRNNGSNGTGAHGGGIRRGRGYREEIVLITMLILTLGHLLE